MWNAVITQTITINSGHFLPLDGSKSLIFNPPYTMTLLLFCEQQSKVWKTTISLIDEEVLTVFNSLMLVRCMTELQPHPKTIKNK